MLTSQGEVASWKGFRIPATVTEMVRSALIKIVAVGWFLVPAVAAAGMPAFNFALSVGGQYSAYSPLVQAVADQERAIYTLVPLRVETGFYLKFLPQLQTGVAFRFDLESNYNPLPPGGAKSFAAGVAAVSARYVFPVVLGDGMSGPTVRLDAGVVAQGASHPSVPGLLWGFDSLVGIGYCIGLLENRSAVTLEVSYSPRVFADGVGHSGSLMLGVLF